MRIEAYTQVQQIYNTRKTNKAQKASNVSFSDQLELSSTEQSGCPGGSWCKV